jgi:N-acyl homoserine lactone hydrolase
MIMSQNSPQRLYLMVVGSMPEYEIPIVCYLVQTGDGKNILVDSGLPEIMPEGESEFENGQDVIEQLASIGLKPDDIDTVISTHYDTDHAGRHAAFTNGSKTWVARRIQMMHTLNNILRLRECRVSSGMVDIIMRRNDCINIVRF